ncbi:hypothetical protein LTR53_015509 [Teratosphaeriaceae sp. CCFEE 6253]|nr:hypothetical protein LTR53_015509 [Teratosphaeriaceae sp. CCFEE 6253]
MADVRELLTNDSIMSKLNDPAQSQMGQRYPLSKLLLFYSFRELARRAPLKGDRDVVFNVMTPGACKSDIFRDDAGLVTKVVMGAAVAALGRSTEVGGRTLVYAVSPSLPAEAHGRFIMDTRVAPNGKNVDGPAGQEIAAKWNAELFAHLETISPGCTSV